ncbi:PilN domain-containing protein [Massilia sp.]|uniref:PilN domain-containing protein n=1 Tax=Massilia sp. TaxID=1882437 RepID=UPI00352FB09B
MSQQINLFNPAFQPQKKIFSVNAMAGALGVLVLLVVGTGVYAKVRIAQVEARVARGEEEVQAAQKRLEAATAEFAPRTKDGRLEAEVAAAQAEHDALRRVADVIQRGDLGNTEGYAEYFRALARQSVDGLWLTGVTITGAGAEIGVRGRALDPALVPGYLARLRNERVLQGKPVGSMQIGQASTVKVRDADGKESDAPAPYVEFSLQSAAAGAAPAPATGGQP